MAKGKSKGKTVTLKEAKAFWSRTMLDEDLIIK